MFGKAITVSITAIVYSIILLFCFTGRAVYAKQYVVRVGDQPVIIDYQSHGKGRTFIHVHQNETTALAAAQAVIQQKGGTLITLKHAGGRNIHFRLKGQYCEFDPNRMFTDRGIKKTLSQWGAYSPAAHREVARLAHAVTRLLPKKGSVIAVHNNATYSLHDYLPGHTLAADAAALYFPDARAFRNFYLVTQSKDYLRLKSFRVNSVLQAKAASDDGSLSIYLANQPYINVEAGYHQLAAQKAMLMTASTITII